MTPERFRFFRVERTPSRPVLLIVMGWLLAGLTLMLEYVFPIDVNPALAVVTAEWVLGIMMFSGGLAVNLSALHHWKNDSTSWRLELIGWPVLGASWLLYTALILYSNWTALFPICLGLAFAAASVQRYLEVKKYIKARRNLSAFEAQQREGGGRQCLIGFYLCLPSY